MDDGVYTSCWNKKGEDPMGTSPFYFSINLFLHQLAIATFLDLCIAQAARLVDFVLRIAALEEEYLTIALEGKNVGTDSVEEPAVVADNHSTASKCFQTFLQGTQRVHVDIVGRFIEEQNITFLLQCQGQLQTVALTTRENTAELALVGAREVETADVSTCIHVSAPRRKVSLPWEITS